MPDTADVIASIVREELAHLTVSSFDELSKLPSYTTKQVARDGHEFAVTIYHESIVPSEHRIVVQAVRCGWLGLYHLIQVDGFVIKTHAERRELTDAEKWLYT